MMDRREFGKSITHTCSEIALLAVSYKGILDYGIGAVAYVSYNDMLDLEDNVRKCNLLLERNGSKYFINAKKNGKIIEVPYEVIDGYEAKPSAREQIFRYLFR